MSDKSDQPQRSDDSKDDGSHKKTKSNDSEPTKSFESSQSKNDQPPSDIPNPKSGTFSFGQSSLKSKDDVTPKPAAAKTATPKLDSDSTSTSGTGFSFGPSRQNASAFSFGSSQPAANSTPLFGSTSSSSGFGSTSNPATSTFGSTSTTSGLFGSSTSGNTAPAPSGFGSSNPGTPAFGASTTSTSGFEGSTPSFDPPGMFGPPPTTTFTSSGFGSTAPTQPTGLFGSSTTTSTPFGASIFGRPAQPASTQSFVVPPSLFANSTTGTGNPPYKAQPETDQNTGSAMNMMTISAMKDYSNKSTDELRWEDYEAKKPQLVRANQPAPGPLPASSSTSLFGTPSQSVFGKTPSKPVQVPSDPTLPPWFGATPQPTFSHLFPSDNTEWFDVPTLFKCCNKTHFGAVFHSGTKVEADIDLEDHFVDVQFILEDGVLNAHQVIVAAHSSFFRKFFRACKKAQKKTNDNDNTSSDADLLPHSFDKGVLLVELKEENLPAFLEVLAFGYGIVANHPSTHDRVIHMLEIAEKFEFAIHRAPLINKLESLVTASNAIEVLKKALTMEESNMFHPKEAIQQLKKKCCLTVVQNFVLLSQTEAFKSLSKEILMDIILQSTDRLQIT